jgi:glycosyltransferase involved in cell wall biosynthesis
MGVSTPRVLADVAATEQASRLTDGARSRSLRIGFVMEQVVGHVTWYQNLRRAITSLNEVEARWVETRLFEEGGLIERIPGLPPIVRSGGRALLDVRRGLRGWHHDALLFNTQKAAMLCQWDMIRTPTMLMTDVTPMQYDRMAELYDHTPDRSAPLRLLKHRVNIMNFHLARALIPSSTWARDSMIRDYGVPPERIHVIPVGTDTARWRPAESRPTNERVRLLFVGGHFERKGGRILLDVFRSLGLHDRAELHVVTRERVEPAPGVTVHTNVQNNSPELLDLFQSADLFVLPTLADCFGNASIEAMAVGLPVITTAIGGIPDIVERGTTGYLLPPGDAAGLAQAVHHLVSNADARRAFSVAARRRALTRFDARTNAAKIVDLARTLVDERQHGAAGALAG